VSPGQRQRNGIRIAAKPLSMRPMWNHEYRGRPRPVPTRNTDLFRHIQCGDKPILFSASRCAAESPRVCTTTLALGVRNPLCLFLGFCRLGSGRPSSQLSRHSGTFNHISFYFGGRLLNRCDFEFSQNRPLQQGGLSPPPLELGAHLYLQALREVPPHPFRPVDGSFFPLIEWPP